jgi:hypothetical protein
MEVHMRQAVIARLGERVRYSTRGAEGAEYFVVDLPSFLSESVHRDDDESEF